MSYGLFSLAECKQGVTTHLVCLNNDSLIRQVVHRRQISCTECSTKAFEVPDKKIRECSYSIIVKSLKDLYTLLAFVQFYFSAYFIYCANL